MKFTKSFVVLVVMFAIAVFAETQHIWGSGHAVSEDPGNALSQALDSAQAEINTQCPLDGKHLITELRQQHRVNKWLQPDGHSYRYEATVNLDGTCDTPNR